MHYQTTFEGFLFQRADKNSPVATGPRLATLDDGQILCTFMLQTKLGSNDFVPMISRSTDHGHTWSKPTPIWPGLRGKQSIFGSISRGGDGHLYYGGMSVPIDSPDESFWSDATSGIKANHLIWARSTDQGHTWSEPAIIPMTIPGSAEAAGPLCVTREGPWLYCYAPYNTFDPNVKVDRSQLAVMRSTDQGKTWAYQPLMKWDIKTSSTAEAWVIQLDDGVLLSSCWHMDFVSKTDYPNPCAYSTDQGKTWSPVKPIGTNGQAVSLLAAPGGRAFMAFNMRLTEKPGVHLACLSPSKSPNPKGYQVDWTQGLWYAPTATQDGSAGEHDNWTSFAYGEPAMTFTKQNNLIAVLWSIEPKDFGGIRLVRLKPV